MSPEKKQIGPKNPNISMVERLDRLPFQNEEGISFLGKIHNNKPSKHHVFIYEVNLVHWSYEYISI